MAVGRKTSCQRSPGAKVLAMAGVGSSTWRRLLKKTWYAGSRSISRFRRGAAFWATLGSELSSSKVFSMDPRGGGKLCIIIGQLPPISSNDWNQKFTPVHHCTCGRRGTVKSKVPGDKSGPFRSFPFKGILLGRHSSLTASNPIGRRFAPGVRGRRRSTGNTRSATDYAPSALTSGIEAGTARLAAHSRRASISSARVVESGTVARIASSRCCSLSCCFCE